MKINQAIRYRLKEKKLLKNLSNLPFFKHMAPCAIKYMFDKAIGRIYPKGVELGVISETGNLNFIFVVNGALRFQLTKTKQNKDTEIETSFVL